MATVAEAEIEQFIYVAETVVRDHTPYVLGGNSLTGGCDCSGVVQQSRLALGLPGGPRTTQGMYAGAGIYTFIPNGQQRRGDLPIFRVNSDGGSAPQHIGIALGDGTMVEEPHTGAFGEIVTIPNIPSEQLMGYLRMVDVVPGSPTPEPGPAPAPPQIFKPLTGRYGVLNKPVVCIVDRPQGDGYWEVAADGGTFNYGAAKFLGSLGSLVLKAPIVDADVTPSGNGLVLVATDGGIFNFGDSNYYGSMGGTKLNAPVVSVSITKSGNGYKLAAADGGVFCFGDAVYLGAAA